MSAEAADLAIEARWILPLADGGSLLEKHTVIVHRGRIVELLPSDLARTRYAPLAFVHRPSHLLMPGLVNAHLSLGERGRSAGPRPEIAMLTLARMLRSGITCCAAVGGAARELAPLALEQGMRVCLGWPIADPSAGAASTFGLDLSEALRLHDEYRRHPSMSTAFALPDLNALDDAMLDRVATLSEEIGATVLASVHRSAEEIEESRARHGARPLARLERHGLLTPALTAAHLCTVEAPEIERAARCGIGVTLCPEADFTTPGALATLAAWVASGLRLSLGRGHDLGRSAPDLWTDLRLLARVARGRLDATGALGIATRGGAAVLGLEESIGTLEAGRWADMICLDLSGPPARGAEDPRDCLVEAGGRDLVSDVWIAGRQLLCEAEFTRLDWPRLAAQLEGARPQIGVIS